MDEIASVGFDRPKLAPLPGSVSFYQRHLLVCTGQAEWPFRGPSGVRSVAVKGNITVNNAETMYELALVYEGMGNSNKAVDLLGKVAKISEAAGHPDSRIRTSNEKLRMIKAK